MTEHDGKSPARPAIDALSPLRWLAWGWRDLVANPLPGLMHGVGLAGFGGLLLWLAHDQFWWLAGAFSGFLIVAPVLATGLYTVSRQAQQGEKVCCREVLRVWLSGDRRLMGFGLLLALAGTGWVLTSAGLITLWSVAPVEKPVDFLHHVVLAPAPGLFEVWLLLGALLAAPMFASSIVTLPMLVDTQAPLWVAVGESWRAVGSHPVVMAFWALLIVTLVGLGLATLMLGLIVIVPVLGHASWHAYVDLKRAGSIRTPRA
ncbi:DUF2189 domain-containing protein [Tepidicella baoligensis]|uniref:DUF2189 domain-containing protein n=1 Tax=Tepidicella baoligensis TaxID=2707016 RepID=UPI0015DA717C|nr:DUF2189 domain-containing protein [Tepidicella baoligensis]